MAHRKLILTEKGAQVYRTRMLSAGDPVTLGASDARLFEKHGWATEKPARKPSAPKALVADPELAEELEAVIPAEPVAEPAKKPAPKRRRTAKKRNA